MNTRNIDSSRPDLHKIALAIRDALISPNCPDSNLEPANVVDGLYRVADSLSKIAEAINNIGHE